MINSLRLVLVTSPQKWLCSFSEHENVLVVPYRILECCPINVYRQFCQESIDEGRSGILGITGSILRISQHQSNLGAFGLRVLSYPTKRQLTLAQLGLPHNPASLQDRRISLL